MKPLFDLNLKYNNGVELEELSLFPEEDFHINWICFKKY